MTKIDTVSKTSQAPAWLVESELASRNTLLGEMHARPFTPVSTPYQFFHYAYLMDEQSRLNARFNLTAIANERGLPTPIDGNKFYKLPFENTELRWEEHTEFSTYRWGYPATPKQVFGSIPVPPLSPPGKLLVASQLQIISEDQLDLPLEHLFDASSLCVVDVFDGNAQVATDFQTDNTGHTKYLIIDKGLGELRTGILTQRVLEIETYRTLALLGLPTARAEAPLVKRTENQLANITKQLSETEDIKCSQRLLNQITSLAAEIEAQVAETAFRFGAGRAYYDIVKTRLKSIEETSVKGRMSFTNFFTRGLAPAIATCDAIEKRQADLSNRLSRTAELLRTRIQFELQHQNSNLLKSMNERTELQFRLQQTVEGLSVIAVSYYAVGLIAYLLKGFTTLEEYISYKSATAIAVPATIFVVWLLTHYLRKKLHK